MIVFALALAAAQPSAEDQVIANYRACTAAVKRDAGEAVARAQDWLVKGGGVLARQCLGLAYTEQEQFPAAAASFEQAAREAETAQDPNRADFWVQAGNAWLAGGNPTRALSAFDAALATTALAPALRGEVHLDRGRAHVALGNPAAARRELDEALKLVPGDPLAWYLSSALAVKQGDLEKARNDIAEAVRLAPADPDLLVHAGNVAGLSGEREAAEGLYMRAIRLSPSSPAAKAAQAALAANQAPVPQP